MKVLKIVLAVLGALLLILALAGVIYALAPRSASVEESLGVTSDNGTDPKIVDFAGGCRKGQVELELKPPSPPTSKLYSFNDGDNNSITLETDGTYFDWWSTLGIDAVIVRSGEDAHAYVYSAPGDQTGEWFQDGGLHGPGGDTSPPKFDQIIVCYDVETEGIGRILVAKDTKKKEVEQSFDFLATGTLGTFSLKHGQIRVFNGVPADRDGVLYSIAETVPSGWSLKPGPCSETYPAPIRDNVAASRTMTKTVSLNHNEEAVCTFTNEPATGHLQVVKRLVPKDDPGLFNLMIDDYVSLDASHGDSTGMMEVLAGTHTVSETAGTDTNLEYYTTSYECGSKEPRKEPRLANGNDGTRNTTYVGAGAEVTCIFTNTRITGTITIEKVVERPLELETDRHRKEPISFEFKTNTKPNFFLLEDGKSRVFAGLPAGDQYKFTELVPEGWELDSISCDGGDPDVNDSTATVTIPILEGGEHITCTFTDKRLPKVSIEKRAHPKAVREPGGIVEYSVRVANEDRNRMVKLTELTDDLYGDLTHGGNKKVLHSTCDAPIKIEPGDEYRCSFKARVKGHAGDVVTDIVTAELKSGEKKFEISDKAKVRIIHEPPETGAGVPVSSAAGVLAAAGMTLTAAGAALRRRKAERG